jgi:hypothetical protein
MLPRKEEPDRLSDAGGKRPPQAQRAHRHNVVCVALLDQPHELPERVPSDYRIAKRELTVDAIQVASASAATLDVAGVLQVAEDPIRVTLRYCGRGCDLSHAHIGPLREGEQDLRVTRDERPPVRSRPSRRTWSGRDL